MLLVMDAVLLHKYQMSVGNTVANVSHLAYVCVMS